MKEEIFKPVKNFEGIYEVSNLGNVKSLNYNKSNKPKIMSGTISVCGYRLVKISKNAKYRSRPVHQLVAESFLNHTPCGHKLVVNHKDLNKLNNHVDNLEIVTQRENANKKHVKSSSNFTGVSWHKQTKKWQSRILIINKDKHLGFFDNELEASEYYKNAVIAINNNQEVIVKKPSYASNYKGVYRNVKNNKWTAQIRINGIFKYLGSFDNEIDAHNTYQNKLKEILNQ